VSPDSDAFLELDNVSKVWEIPGRRLEVLTGIDLEIDVGESIAILGPSGSGKSTLLHVMGLLTPPTGGDIRFQKKSAMNFRGRARLNVRREIGFVFQDAKLLPGLNLFQNVCVPLVHRYYSAKEQKRLAMEVLEKVGLEEHLTHLPHHLSGGELTRAAIARALAFGPRLLLCDEPTGALDDEIGENIFDLLLRSIDPSGALVVVTHNQRFAKKLDRVLRLNNGQLTDVGRGRDSSSPPPSNLEP